MKIKEAKLIVGKMVQWTMLSQGIELNEVPEQITESLPTLLKANQIVVKFNERNKFKANAAAKAGFVASRTVHMVLADRGIAALYVAANFPGDNSETVDVLAQHNTNLVICIDKLACKVIEEV